MTIKKRKSTAFSTGFVMIVFYFGLFNLLLLPILAVKPDISGRPDKTLLTQEVAAIERCSPRDIVVYQGATGTLPNGIPTYTVEISNISPNGISRIHLKCGWFSSARLVNPKIFKRISFDDCLVNDGMPLLSGRTISFRYATTFPYQLSVKEVYCA